MADDVKLSEGKLVTPGGAKIGSAALNDDDTFLTSADGNAAYVPSAATQAGTGAAPTATTVWRFNAPDPTVHGPFSLVVGGSLFQSTFDRVMYLGYNAADGGGTIVNSEPKFSFQIESDYDDSAKRALEMYPEYGRASAVSFTDGVTTNGSPTVTSAATTFTTTYHKGRAISGSGIPASTYIGVVNSDHSIGLSSSATSNVPVNATATATGVTLSIVPSGPASIRPWFVQINKATGAMSFELNATAGFSFNTTDGNQTNWGALGPTGLQINPLTGQSVALTLGWVSGGQNSFSIGNGTSPNNGFLLQPLTVGGSVWQAEVGGVDSFQFTAGRFQAGDTTVNKDGALTLRVTTADKDAVNTLHLRAQTSQSTSLLMCKSADNGTYLMSIEVDGSIRSLSTAGIKIGTATTQKFGFWGATPVAQQARPTDAATIITLLTTLGLCA